MSRERVLALCTTALGDTLLCTPALIALGRRFVLEVVVHQHQRPLLLGNPHLQRLYPYRNNPAFRLGLGLWLKRRAYHRLVVLHANRDVLGLLRRLRYEQAANLQGWEDPRLRLQHLETPRKWHVVDKRLALAAWAGAPEGEPRLRVFLHPRELAQGQAWLREHGLDHPRVALCPGAAYPYKMWPAEYFGRLARGLREQGAAVLLLGSRRERELLRQVQQAAGLALPAAVGLPLRLAAAVLAGCDLLVSNDTGPLHLAQAVDTPVLGLFGPTDPDTIGPRGGPHRVLSVPPTCDPCTTKRCPRGECLAALEPGQVLATACAMLEEAADS